MSRRFPAVVESVLIAEICMSFDYYLQHVMSGQAIGPRAAALRAVLSAATPFYAAAVGVRNGLYDRGIARARRLPRPVIGIGNITTGGTGKTPLVRWLAARLRDEGRRVAILSRGYKAVAGSPGALGDEQLMLERALNGPGAVPVVVRANPDRFAAATATLREQPAPDVFLLDDGFQHRALSRDLDIVLLNATEPFGFGRLLPRGLLREPLSGLRRAGAFVLTHALRVDDARLREIESAVRRHHPSAPIYRAVHAPSGLRSATASAAAPPDRSVDDLRWARVFAFCGIGSPDGFEREVRDLCGAFVGSRWFRDHHAYTPADVAAVRGAAREAGADVLVTTEKDWVKLSSWATATDVQDDAGPPIWRLDVEARFLDSDEERLLAQVRRVVEDSVCNRLGE